MRSLVRTGATTMGPVFKRFLRALVGQSFLQKSADFLHFLASPWKLRRHNTEGPQMDLIDKPSPFPGLYLPVSEAETPAPPGDENPSSLAFTVSMSAIEADPDQPRRHIDQAALEDMAASFKTVGLLQPLLVRKHPKIRRRWILVAGDRRWRAAKLAGWTEIAAIEITENFAEATLIENIQRIDLTVMEEGRALQKLLHTHFWTQERCATALGIDAPRVSAALNVLTLPGSFLADVASGAVTVPRNVLVELARIKEAPLRDRMIALARDGDLTIRLLRAGRREAVEGPAPAPAESPAQRHVAEPAGLKPARLTHLLSTLNAVFASDYHPTPDEIEKLGEVKAAIDRIIAESRAEHPEDIDQLILL